MDPDRSKLLWPKREIRLAGGLARRVATMNDSAGKPTG